MIIIFQSSGLYPSPLYLLLNHCLVQYMINMLLSSWMCWSSQTFIHLATLSSVRKAWLPSSNGRLIYVPWTRSKLLASPIAHLLIRVTGTASWLRLVHVMLQQISWRLKMMYSATYCCPLFCMDYQLAQPCLLGILTCKLSYAFHGLINIGCCQISSKYLNYCFIVFMLLLLQFKGQPRIAAFAAICEWWAKPSIIIFWRLF
jgi:hypothetical protein